MRALRHKNTAYTPSNIQSTVPYGGGSEMLWVYLSWLHAGFSHHTRQYNWWSVHQRRLATSCCPPFRQLPTSYKACVYGCQASSCKSSNRLPPKRSRDFCSLTTPYFYPIEHIWDMLGRRIRAREHPVQNIRHLEAALHREWQQLSQQDIRRLTGVVRRMAEVVIQARGVTTGTELWTIDVVKWFIRDVVKVKWQWYRAFWTVKVNT
jgi:hypothetical protein